MSQKLDTVAVKLSTGKVVPFEAQVSKHGNVYWALLSTRPDGSKYKHPYGRFVSKKLVGDRLPEWIEVHGQRIPVTRDDDAESGNKRVRAQATVEIPGHGTKVLSFRETTSGDGFNVAGRIHGKGGGGKPRYSDEW